MNKGTKILAAAIIIIIFIILAYLYMMIRAIKGATTVVAANAVQVSAGFYNSLLEFGNLITASTSNKYGSLAEYGGANGYKFPNNTLITTSGNGGKITLVMPDKSSYPLLIMEGYRIKLYNIGNATMSIKKTSTGVMPTDGTTGVVSVTGDVNISNSEVEIWLTKENNWDYVVTSITAGSIS